MIRLLAICLLLAVSACGTYTIDGTLSISPAAATVAPYSSVAIKVFESVDGGSTFEVTSEAQIGVTSSAGAGYNSKTHVLVTNGYGGTVTVKATWQGQTASTTFTLTPAVVVNAWGDTLTYGPGNAAQSYPGQLGTALLRKVINDGVKAQTSGEIAARQGGAPAHLDFAGNDLAASTASAVTVDVPLLLNTPAGTALTGTVGTFHGTLTRTTAAGQDSYTFQQDPGGTEQTVPDGSAFIPDTSATYSQVNLIWVGRGNYEQAAHAQTENGHLTCVVLHGSDSCSAQNSPVESDIAAMVGKLTNGNYLVLSVLNGAGEGKGTAAYAAITQLNADLARTYGAKFVDVRTALVNAYNPAKAQDVQDHANDIPPTSLRVDNVNLQAAGYTVVEQTVAAAMTVQGY